MHISVKTDIEKQLSRIVEIVENCLVEEFKEWAMQDDDYLRSNDGFINRSGNLRSSLGSGVVKNGDLVFTTPFNVVLNGTEGAEKGRSLLEQLAPAYQNQIAKVIVAGMDYAQEVEDIQSKDVLESRTIQCEREAEGVVRRALDKAEALISQLL